MSKTKPSIVFAHGLWADGSCFSKVIPQLQADGYQVVAAQNSLDTLAGDVAAVSRALGRVSSPAILVGHSYGGTIITAAGADKRVAGLVYIAALAPDDDETSQSLIDKFPTSRRGAHLAQVQRHRVFRRRPLERGAEARRGNAGRAGRRSLQSKAARHGLEVEAELVCLGQERPHGSPRPSALRLEAHGRDGIRSRQQPRAHAFEACAGDRRDPQGGKGSRERLKSSH